MNIAGSSRLELGRHLSKISRRNLERNLRATAAFFPATFINLCGLGSSGRVEVQQDSRKSLARCGTCVARSMTQWSARLDRRMRPILVHGSRRAINTETCSRSNVQRPAPDQTRHKD